jgi:hypothetical protein
MRCPQNTQKPKLQRTTRGGQTKVKNKKEPAKRGRGEGKKKGGGESSHTRGRGQVNVAGLSQHEPGMHPR